MSLITDSGPVSLIDTFGGALRTIRLSGNSPTVTGTLVNGRDVSGSSRAVTQPQRIRASTNDDPRRTKSEEAKRPLNHSDRRGVTATSQSWSVRLYAGTGRCSAVSITTREWE